MIWFTSDLHYGHKAIINLCEREFSSVEEMNRTLIQNWNSVVKRGDTVYILGDISHRCSVEEVNEFISKLNGKKILIRGNHDKEYDFSLFEEVVDYLELKGYASVGIVLMHYPLLEWNGLRKGAIHLHGHQHNKMGYNEQMCEEGIRRYDVGVDANQYSPVSLKQILEFFGLD